VSNATHLTSVGAGPGNWRTPPELFGNLQRTFQFDYDAFASHENALCETYSTVDGTYRKREDVQPWPDLVLNPQPPRRWQQQIDGRDGLTQLWQNMRVFMNPPYGRGVLEQAMAKAASERDSADIIVALIPANTDTGWWHDYVKPYATVYFLRRRVKFIDPITGEPGGSPPGGSAVAVYVPEFLR
jgi:phage N-6-adenine-methyltransferase